MSNKKNLMRPMRSDELKPHPAPQAAWPSAPSAANATAKPKAAPPPAPKAAQAPALEKVPVLPDVFQEELPASPVVFQQEEPVLPDAFAQEDPVPPVAFQKEEPVLPDAFPEEDPVLPDAFPEEEPVLPDPSPAEEPVLSADFQEEAENDDFWDVLFNQASPEDKIPLITEDEEDDDEDEDEDIDDTFASGFSFDSFPEPPIEESSLGDILSSLAKEDKKSKQKPPKKEKHSDSHDAVPTHLMPVPVCVPLFEDSPAPAPKRRGWIWMLAICVVLAAGGAFAAWYLGLIPWNLA